MRSTRRKAPNCGEKGVRSTPNDHKTVIHPVSFGDAVDRGSSPIRSPRLSEVAPESAAPGPLPVHLVPTIPVSGRRLQLQRKTLCYLRGGIP